MPEEEEYLKLPVETRWTHANWKARKSAYDETTENIANGRNQGFPPPDSFRAACSDTNVIALESGIKLLVAYLDTLDLEDTQAAIALREQVAKPLTEKGLPALKPTVKTAAKEALLKLVAVADPNGVVADVLVNLGAKSPKLVVGAIQMLTAIYTEFGAPVAECKPVLQSLPALFGNSDPKIRTSAAELAVALCRWIGEQPTLTVLKDIKPLQQKDLKERFTKIQRDQPAPRLTQQQAADAEAAAHAATAGGADAANEAARAGDVDMDGANTQSDGWEYLDPVDVVSKIPEGFWTNIQSAKWKERLDSLTTVAEMLEKAARMDPKADYSRLVSELLRIIAKDANQMCASQAIVAVTALTTGLRDAFTRQASPVIEHVVERFKEKRPAAIEAVVNCLDATFAKSLAGNPSPVLEQVWPVASTHKLPTVRLESTRYLVHLLTECRTAPKLSMLEEIATGSVKFLSDPQDPMRTAGAALIAVVVKITGEKRMASVLRGLDEHKKKRVDAALATAQANCKLSSAPASEPAKMAKPGPGKLSATTSRTGRGGRPVPSTTRRAGSTVAPSTNAGTNATSVGTNSSIASTTTNTQTGAAPSLRPAAPARSNIPPRNTAPAPRMAAPPGHVNARPSYSHTASPIGRRGMPTVMEDTSLSFTSPSHMDAAVSRESRPSISSTPKVVKRTVQRAEFTPARDYEAHRRRMTSPARMHTDEDSADEGPDIGETDGSEHAMHEIARLTAQLNLEKSLRSELEKRLAHTQVEKDQEIMQLREDNATLRVQLHAQREELRVWIQSERQRQAASAVSSEDVSTRLSVLNIDSDLQSSRPSSVARPESGSPSHRGVGRSVPNRNSMLPISVPPPATQPSQITSPDSQGLKTDSQSWERAVSMTHNLKQRIEQLKQMKERTF